MVQRALWTPVGALVLNTTRTAQAVLNGVMVNEVAAPAAPVGGYVMSLVPASDVEATGWSSDTGATTSLFNAIDEGAAVGSDADFIRSPPNPAGARYRCKLAVGGGVPGRPTAGKLKIRWKADFAASSPTVVVRLFEGATERASWTYNAFPDNALVENEVALTGAQLAAITDFDNLFAEAEVTASA